MCVSHLHVLDSADAKWKLWCVVITVVGTGPLFWLVWRQAYGYWGSRLQTYAV